MTIQDILDMISSTPVQSAAYTPSLPYNGKLPKGVVKKGTKGSDAKAVQKFLNWSIHAGLKVDGTVGKKTVRAIKSFQKTHGLKADGVFGKATKAKAQKVIESFKPKKKSSTAPAPTKKASTSKKGNKLVQKARELAWPKGTKAKKYKYRTGAPTKAFKTALKHAYPNRKGWGKAPKVGASCDVFVGTCVREAGLGKECPRGLKGMYKYKSKNFKRKVYKNVRPIDVSKDGDWIVYAKNAAHTKGHTLIRGDGGLYEAGFENSWGHFQKSLKKIKRKYPYVIVFRMK